MYSRCAPFLCAKYLNVLAIHFRFSDSSLANISYLFASIIIGIGGISSYERSSCPLHYLSILCFILRANLALLLSISEKARFILSFTICIQNRRLSRTLCGADRSIEIMAANPGKELEFITTLVSVLSNLPPPSSYICPISLFAVTPIGALANVYSNATVVLGASSFPYDKNDCSTVDLPLFRSPTKSKVFSVLSLLASFDAIRDSAIYHRSIFQLLGIGGELCTYKWQIFYKYNPFCVIKILCNCKEVGKQQL